MLKSYLSYFEAKNIHQLHIEQLSLQGIDELRSAINSFQALRDDFLRVGISKEKIDVSIKWDGSPAIICGVNPENNKFFVSTKSAFSKTPKLAYTQEDLNKFKEGPADKLKIALQYLPRLGIKGIYQGDLMFTEDIKKIEDINGKKYIIFKPNTITYAVELNSELGIKINNAKIGLVFHTQYKGNKIEELTASPVKNLPFNKTNDVWFISAELKRDDISADATLTYNEVKYVNQKLSLVGKLFRTLSKEFYNELKESKLDIAIETTINKLIRQGTIFNDIENFIIKVKEEIPNISMISKKRADMAMEFIQNNREKIIYMMHIYKLLYEIKMVFLPKMNYMSSIKTFIQDENGFRATSPEGFCIANINDGKITKLVDRLNFSRNNFNMVKNWGTS